MGITSKTGITVMNAHALLHCDAHLDDVPG
ncbi:hypothetical protein SUDANB180_00127 [Streptomyces sp. enrichment culture]